MKKITLQLETLTCPSCTNKIEGGLRSLKEVDEVKVLFNASKVKAEFDETKVLAEEIKSTIERLGYEVKSYKIA